MKCTKLLMLSCAAFAGVSGIACADNGALAAREVPARTLPVPTDVSPELQKLIAAPDNPARNVLWQTGEEWRAAANAQAAHVMPTLAALRKRLGVTVQSSAMNGVRVYVVTPEVIVIAPEHRDEVLIHVHGGCYELFPGESGTGEAVIMAASGIAKSFRSTTGCRPRATSLRRSTTSRLCTRQY
jgi:acetyl esterase/lipase